MTLRASCATPSGARRHMLRALPRTLLIIRRTGLRHYRMSSPAEIPAAAAVDTPMSDAAGAEGAVLGPDGQPMTKSGLKKLAKQREFEAKKAAAAAAAEARAAVAAKAPADESAASKKVRSHAWQDDRGAGSVWSGGTHTIASALATAEPRTLAPAVAEGEEGGGEAGLRQHDARGRQEG